MARLFALTLTIATIFPTPARADSQASRGMGKGDGPCMAIATPAEQALMRHESRGWPTARNPHSTAFGCGQLLHNNRVRLARLCGVTPNTTSPTGSMCLLRGYVRERYRTPERALQFRLARGWY